MPHCGNELPDIRNRIGAAAIAEIALRIQVNNDAFEFPTVPASGHAPTPSALAEMPAVSQCNAPVFQEASGAKDGETLPSHHNTP